MSQKRRLKKAGKKPTKRTPKKKAVIKKKPARKKAKKYQEHLVIANEKPIGYMEMPAPDQLRVWLQSNVELINITGWERKAGLPRTTLRQISAGKRQLTKVQLAAVTDKILPELKIIALLLMKYEKEVFGITLKPSVN